MAAPAPPDGSIGNLSGAAARATTARWRIITAWVLLVVATFVVMGAALDVWIKRQALDTDNWVATSDDMLGNDQIRHALAVTLADELYADADVEARLEQRLPDRLDPLAAPLARVPRQAAIGAADKLLGQPVVQDAWRLANRRAHELFIAMIDGDIERLEATNGEVVLDLRPLVADLARVQGLDVEMPPDVGRLVILRPGQLDAAQTAVRAIRAMSYLLGVLALVLYALAVFLVGTGRRRAMILTAGSTLLLVGVALLVIRRLAGHWVVDSMTTTTDFRAATAAAWAIGTQLLRTTGITLIAWGAAVVAAAWVAGGSRAPTAIRRWLAPTLREHPMVVYAVVTMALLVVLAAGPTDAGRRIASLILFGFAYSGVEVLRRQTAREFPVVGESAAHTDGRRGGAPRA